jgi:Acetoacetate decarboxylase (ADC)
MARSVSTFEGDVVRSARPSAGKWSPFGFVGRMTAIGAILPVSRAAARAMLPAGLDLATQDVVPGDRHPLVLILGQQSNVRPSPLPFGADYLEFILAVPFVEHGGDGSHRPLCYCPRLYLDRSLPIVVGRLLYGYDKRRAVIRMTADSYHIAEPGSAEPLLEAHFRTTGAAVEPSRSSAAGVFDLPVIAQAPRGWRYSFAHFGLDRAVMQPVELDLVIHRPFVPGLPVGAFAISGVEGDASRAFRIRTSWRLAGPWARRSPPYRGLDNGPQNKSHGRRAAREAGTWRRS